MMPQTSLSPQKKAPPTAVEALHDYIANWVQEDPSLKIYVYVESPIENYSVEVNRDITET